MSVILKLLKTQKKNVKDIFPFFSSPPYFQWKFISFLQLNYFKSIPLSISQGFKGNNNNRNSFGKIPNLSNEIDNPGQHELTSVASVSWIIVNQGKET